MALTLKQSTAVDVLIGPFVDRTDGYTSETGESPSVKLSKNGQTLAAKNDATTPVHDADGYYNCELDATDTNTVGTLVATVAASANALPVRHEFYVVEEAVYDVLYAASAEGPLQGTTAGNKLDVTATGAAGIDWGNVENKTTANDLSATDIQLCDTVTTLTGHTAQTGDSFARIGVAGAGLTAINLPNQTMDITGSITGNLSGSVGSVTGAVGSVTGSVGSVVGHTAQTGDSFARLGGPAGASVSADIAAVKVDTAATVVDTANLNDTTHAEPGQAAPPGTASLITKVNYLYKAWRNKSTQNATEYNLFDDAGGTVDQKAAVSDDGTTATKGEITTGP